MAIILSGEVETFQQAEEIVQKILQTGYSNTDINVFFLNADGQHATYPIGGDMDADAGALQADKGAGKGAMIGGGAGLLAGATAALVIPGFGPVIALALTGVGAYTGALMGGLNATEGNPTGDSFSESKPGGVIIAVHIHEHAENEVAAETTAVEKIFSDSAVKNIQQHMGNWEKGQWIDADVSHFHAVT